MTASAEGQVVEAAGDKAVWYVLVVDCFLKTHVARILVAAASGVPLSSAAAGIADILGERVRGEQRETGSEALFHAGDQGMVIGVAVVAVAIDIAKRTGGDAGAGDLDGRIETLGVD